jgi:hypothetical protein
MNEHDLSRAVWRTSSYSNGQGGNCVECATSPPGIVAVRDTKNRTDAVLRLTAPQWQAFLAGVRNGEFD